MDFKDTPEQANFRKTCREWLEKNAKLKTGVEKNEFANIDFLQVAKDWQKKKYDAGWAMLHWPCLLYTSPSPRDVEESRMPSSA